MSRDQFQKERDQFQKELTKNIQAYGWDWCSIDGDLILAGSNKGQLNVYCVTRWRSWIESCPIHSYVLIRRIGRGAPDG